jgi:hypothetical protein
MYSFIDRVGNHSACLARITIHHGTLRRHSDGTSETEAVLGRSIVSQRVRFPEKSRC